MNTFKMNQDGDPSSQQSGGSNSSGGGMGGSHSSGGGMGGSQGSPEEMPKSGQGGNKWMESEEM